MEFDVTSKLIFGVFSSLGTVALVFYNLSQSRKIKAELVEKFEDALVRENKHSVTELFRLIHGMRMSYSDILALVDHDSCSKIIFAIKTTPGLVTYEGGAFRYRGIARSRQFRLFDLWFSRISITLLSALSLASLLVMSFTDGVSAVAGFTFLIAGSFMLAMQLRQRAYDQMIANLVEPEYGNPM